MNACLDSCGLSLYPFCYWKKNSSTCLGYFFPCFVDLKAKMQLEFHCDCTAIVSILRSANERSVRCVLSVA